MESNEIRMRCVEAAVRVPQPGHNDGPLAAVLEAAEKFYGFVAGDKKAGDGRPTLTVRGTPPASPTGRLVKGGF